MSDPLISSSVFRHHNMFRCGQTLDWCPSDTEERFQQNLRDSVRRQMLQDFGWLDPATTIRYRFNSHGFRADEFLAGPCAMAVGCSFTDGIGLAEHHAWPSRLKILCDLDSRGLQHIWNLGLGGGGADTCLRVIQHWAPLLKPSFIVVLLPPEPRLEFENLNGDFGMILSESLGPGLIGQRDQFLKHWFAQDDNWLRYTEKNIMAMRWFCRSLDIPLLIYEYNMLHKVYLDKHGPFSEVPLARDLEHAGPECHQLLAERIMDDIQANSWYDTNLQS